MRVSEEVIKTGPKSTMNARVAWYTGPSDLAKHQGENKYDGARNNDSNWAGGTKQDFQNGCIKGDLAYARCAEKFVDQFANLAIQDYERVLGYNEKVGMVDIGSMYSGDPMCMYGPTIEETDTAPINVYIDTWTSFAIPTDQMERRGVAVLALVQALSVFRPVNVSLVTGTHHSPSRTNVIQVLALPTAPMDLARASWMLASPLFFRRGFLPMTWAIARDKRHCGIPMLSDSAWQEQELGNWLAAKSGVNEVVHLPYMMHKSSTWSTDAATLNWVKETVAKYAAT